tara:strand:- start:2774 stop:3784 length:1011 start_codon:yes stop_codon:yes gene_type:complete
MSGKGNKAANARAKVVQEIADMFKKQIKEGVKPWNKPWDTSKCSTGMAHNIVSGKPYRGVNQFILQFAGDTEFASFKQWSEVGRKYAIEQGEYELREGKNGKPYKHTTTYYGVQKGMSAHTVVYFNLIKIKEKDDYGNEEEKRIPILKWFKVFGRSQTNIPANPIDLSEEEKLSMTEREEAIEQELFDIYLDKEGIPVSWGGARAFYSLGRDSIGMPDRHAFPDGYAMLPTLFHESIHSTGHPKRKNRTFGIFGDKEYAFEELVAEMGASLLCRHFNILPSEALEDGLENQASYIASWLKRLDSDPGFIIKAGSRAQAAVDYILQTTFEEEEKKDE